MLQLVSTCPLEHPAPCLDIQLQALLLYYIYIIIASNYIIIINSFEEQAKLLVLIYPITLGLINRINSFNPLQFHNHNSYS